jgi:hypothetical protein
MKASRLDESVFDHLSERSGEDLISVFIPTHRAGREIAQDRIYLKNQLSSVEDALTDLGWKPRERSERLSRGRELLDDVEFWEHQDAGLALYIDDDGEFDAVSSANPLEAFGVVMPVFMLRPLIADMHPVVAPVLALTKDEVALFEVSESAATVMDADLPAYEDVNWFVDRETQRQQHPDQAGSGRNRHGHRSSTKSDEDFARFLREVDSAVKGFEEGTPLVVLGDDDMVARFSNHSDRETVSPANSGITAPFSEAQVYEMVSRTIEDMARARVDVAKARARDQLGVGMGSTRVDDALPAAVSGRVAAIVIHRGADPVWGRLNEATLEVDAHEERRPGDVDLLDRLVVWARNNGASIVSSETPVDDGAFIATLRY